MGFAYYKAKSQTQKRPNRSNREEFLEGNQAFQPINDSITPGGNSNDCEQKVRFMPYYYHDIEKERYDWPADDIEDINRALMDAITHLEGAINYLNDLISHTKQESKRKSEDKIEKYNTVLNVVQKVRDVLQNGGLQIFPLEAKCYGLSQKGPRQISINVALHRENSNLLYSLAKTLIHESFHIIGGCTSNKRDTSCNDSLKKEEALKSIYLEEIKNMAADYFAQFVMQC